MFVTINKAKKAVSSTLSAQDVEKCRKAFAIYDRNGACRKSVICRVVASSFECLVRAWHRQRYH